MIFISLWGIALTFTTIGLWHYTMEYGFSFIDLFFFLGLFLIGTILEGIIFFLLAIGVGYFLPMKEKLIETYEIVAIKDNSSTTGSFFLGTGQVDSEIRYYFYKKDGSGYRSDYISGDVVIYENEKENPHISVFESSTYGWWKILGFDFKERYEIHIPENSIIRNFKLDN